MMASIRSFSTRYCDPLCSVSISYSGISDRCPVCGSLSPGGSEMMSGFRQFLLRGNVVDLAVAVVIGGAFGAVVTALVKGLLTPLIGAVAGTPDFSVLSFTVNGSQFLIGDVVNAVVSFLLISAAVYFLVIVPVNA